MASAQEVICEQYLRPSQRTLRAGLAGVVFAAGGIRSVVGSSVSSATLIGAGFEREKWFCQDGLSMYCQASRARAISRIHFFMRFTESWGMGGF
ncbi:hypothetical protein A9C11_28200 [Pseudomonas citronellolis]|uniref:Uncharacterized protein n=1 Tax=Pseudomonas citronellolis TaxID=53408 RepID=A0A1A9KJH7_9PSED|nr:hypothetical protein A9C11_28200 [Pseudomonas citronellolis]